MKSKTTHFQRKQVRARQELLYWRCDRILNRVFIRKLLGILSAASLVIWGLFSFWQVPFSFSQSSSVVISEIKYDTDSPKSEGCSDLRYFEWVEIYNLNQGEIDLSGWFIGDSEKQADKIETKVEGTSTIVPGKSYLVIAAKKQCFLKSYPSFSGNLVSLESYFGSYGLNNDGDAVVLCGSVSKDCGIGGSLDYRQYPDKAVMFKENSYALDPSDNVWKEANPTPGAENSFPKEDQQQEDKQVQPTINFSAPATVLADTAFSVTVTLKNFKAGTYSLKVLIGKGDKFYDGKTKGTDGKWLAWNAGWVDFPKVSVGSSGSGSKKVQAKTDDDVVAGNYLIKVRAYDGKNTFDSDSKSLKVVGLPASKSSSSGSEEKTQDLGEFTGEVGEITGGDGEVKGEETSQGEGFKLNFYTILGIFGMLVGGGGLILSFAKKRVPGPEGKRPPSEHSEERGS